MMWQRYGGLTIQPVSEQAGILESIIKELEAAEKILHETIVEVRNSLHF